MMSLLHNYIQSIIILAYVGGLHSFQMNLFTCIAQLYYVLYVTVYPQTDYMRWMTKCSKATVTNIINYTFVSISKSKMVFHAAITVSNKWIIYDFSCISYIWLCSHVIWLWPLTLAWWCWPLKKLRKYFEQVLQLWCEDVWNDFLPLTLALNIEKIQFGKKNPFSKYLLQLLTFDTCYFC